MYIAKNDYLAIVKLNVSIKEILASKLSDMLSDYGVVESIIKLGGR